MTPSPGGATTGKRDLAWIKQALQTAIELECTTLPLYLAALFSLEVQNYPAYNAIRAVVMEEMVHMAINANMLAGLGGSPRIRSIQFTFPGKGLPGGAEPDLEVVLAQLSKRQLKNFMRLETPEFLLRQAYRNETYPTIAVFYSGIRDAIRHNADAVRAAVKAGGPANQVGDDIGFKTIQRSSLVDPVDQLLSGIEEILEQGEGSSSDSLFAGKGFEDEASHYCRFAEIYYGANYEDPTPPRDLTPETEPHFFCGRPIPWPIVVNTLAVPADGYARILAQDPEVAAVTTDLEAFDAAFSSILAALDAVWNGPANASWKTLGGAVHSMVDLRVLSCFNLLRHQVPAEIVRQLDRLYPNEAEHMRKYTDLTKPVVYGPRFLNKNVAASSPVASTSK